MKILNHLVIKKEVSKYEPDLPYVLWIADSGRVGDKCNFGPGKTGKSFPPEASDRFATLEDATRAHTKMLAYIKDRMGLDETLSTPPNKELDEKLTRGKSFSCKLWE